MISTNGQNGLLERKINPGSSTGRRRQQESFLRIVIPKDCISFLTTGFDWGIHITKQDETEKHFMPRYAPIVFAAVIFGNIWGPSTRSKPRHHSSCVIGALQNTLKSLLVNLIKLETRRITRWGKLLQEIKGILAHSPGRH